MTCGRAATVTSSAAIAGAAAKSSITSRARPGPGPNARPASRRARRRQRRKRWFRKSRQKKTGVRVFIVHSDERAAFEQAQRVKAMGRVRTSLEKLAQRIQKGRLKAPEKVGAAAGRILRNHGHRYYGWCYE